MSATKPTVPDATAIPDVPEAADKAEAPEPAAYKARRSFVSSAAPRSNREVR